MILITKLTIDYEKTLRDNQRIEARLNEILKYLKLLVSVPMESGEPDKASVTLGDLDSKYFPIKKGE